MSRTAPCVPPAARSPSSPTAGPPRWRQRARWWRRRSPTLAEQLADLRARGGNLLLEIKAGYSRDEVAKVIAIVREQQMTNRVLLQSFDLDVLRASYELAPELPIGLLRLGLDADPVALAKDLHLTAYVPSGVSLLTRPAGVALLLADRRLGRAANRRTAQLPAPQVMVSPVTRRGETAMKPR